MKHMVRSFGDSLLRTVLPGTTAKADPGSCWNTGVGYCRPDGVNCWLYRCPDGGEYWWCG